VSGLTLLCHTALLPRSCYTGLPFLLTLAFAGEKKGTLLEAMRGSTKTVHGETTPATATTQGYHN